MIQYLTYRGKSSMRTLKKQKSILCALAVSTLVSQSLSITYAAEPEEFSLDQMVVTANRVSTKMNQTAANMTVITAEQIANSHYNNLGDVLKNVNGVFVTNNGFAGSAQGLFINGDDRVAVMIDGRKMSRPEGEFGRAGFDLSNMTSLANIERIEIVKGGASALYGSDAVGGVVNIITKKGLENQTTINTAVGSGGQKEYGISNQGKEGKFSWYVSADQKKQDHSEYNSLSNGETKQWPNSGFDKKDVTIRLDQVIDDNRSVTLNFEHLNSETGQPYSLSYAPTKLTSKTFGIWNNWAATYNFNEKGDVPGFIRLYSNYYHRNFVDPYGGINKSRTTGAQYQTGWKIDDKNTLIVGSEWEKGEVLENSKADGNIKYKDKSITNTAFYLQDIYKMADKWTVTPGIRYDNHSKFGGKTTPKINVNYSADQDTDIYVSYNKVFKAPNLNDLYESDDWGWGMGTFGNPNLKPESGHVVTLGINKKLSNTTSISANYFESEITDAIKWLETVSGNGRYVASNVNREKKRGGELNLKHNFSPKYYAQVGYSYLHSEMDEGVGYKVFSQNTQPNGYRVNLGYHDEQWNIGIDGISAAGRDSAQFINSSYWVWNMNVNYKLAANTNVYVKANNITNEAYQVIASTKGDYPMPARNFQFGVQYKM